MTSHIFTYDFRKVWKCHLLLKKRRCFSWKKVFHKICYPDGIFLVTQCLFYLPKCRMTFMSSITAVMENSIFLFKSFWLLFFALLFCLLDLKCQRSMKYKYKVYQLRDTWMNCIFIFYILTYTDLQCIQINPINLKLWHDNCKESENKTAKLMFPNWFWSPKLKVLHFSSHERRLQSHIVHVTLFSGLSGSLIPHFSFNSTFF